MKKSLFIMKTAIQSSMEYRLNFVGSLLNLIVPIFINCAFWFAIYNASPDATAHYGFTFGAMIVYVFTSNLIYFFIGTDFAADMSNEIYRGTLSQYLVKPVNYMQYRFFRYLGGIAVEGCAFVVMTVIFFAVVAHMGLYSFELWRILLFIPCTVLAAFLNYLIFYCLTMAGFWFTQVWYMYWAMGQFARLLNGAVVPLNVLGTGFMTVSRFLPFQYTVYFPSSVLLRGLPFGETLWGICIQIAWIGITFLLAQVLWERGLRKYTAVGG